MKKQCNCWRPTAEGHDYSCRTHPRFKRNRMTDTKRLNAIIKWAKDALDCSESDKVLWAENLRSRKHMDLAIREDL